MLSGAAVLGALAIATGELIFRLDQVTQEALAALAYLTLVGSLVAFTAYVWVLRRAPHPLIATYAFVTPSWRSPGDRPERGDAAAGRGGCRDRRRER